MRPVSIAIIFVFLPVCLGQVNVSDVSRQCPQPNSTQIQNLTWTGTVGLHNICNDYAQFLGWVISFSLLSALLVAQFFIPGEYNILVRTLLILPFLLYLDAVLIRQTYIVAQLYNAEIFRLIGGQVLFALGALILALIFINLLSILGKRNR